MSDRDWIGRVRQADAEAEEIWLNTETALHRQDEPEEVAMLALIAIAAELRAQRISRRPGAGTPTVPGAPSAQ